MVAPGTVLGLCLPPLQHVQGWRGSGTLEDSQGPPLRRSALTAASPRQAWVLPRLPPMRVRVAAEGSVGNQCHVLLLVGLLPQQKGLGNHARLAFWWPRGVVSAQELRFPHQATTLIYAPLCPYPQGHLSPPQALRSCAGTGHLACCCWWGWAAQRHTR